MQRLIHNGLRIERVRPHPGKHVDTHNAKAGCADTTNNNWNCPRAVIDPDAESESHGTLNSTMHNRKKTTTGIQTPIHINMTIPSRVCKNGRGTLNVPNKQSPTLQQTSSLYKTQSLYTTPRVQTCLHTIAGSLGKLHWKLNARRRRNPSTAQTECQNAIPQRRKQIPPTGLNPPARRPTYLMMREPAAIITTESSTLPASKSPKEPEI